MLLEAEHGYRYPAQLNSIDPLGMDTMVIVYAAEQAWMPWSSYAAVHGYCSVEHGCYYYPVGTDAMVIVRSRTWILSCAVEYGLQYYLEYLVGLDAVDIVYAAGYG